MIYPTSEPLTIHSIKRFLSYKNECNDGKQYLLYEVNSTKRRKGKEKKRKLVKLSRVIVTHAFIDTIIGVFLQSDE